MQSGLFDAAPTAPVLRTYQANALDRVEETIAQGVRALLLVAPTGSGKTVLGAEIIRRGGEDGSLFLAPRRELIHQTSRKLHDVGVSHGIILAGASRGNSYAQTQVASVDTLLARMIRTQKIEWRPFKRIIVDEAHVGLTETREKLLNLWPEATIIGLTATPTRSDGKALGRVYDELIEVATVAELTEQGFLAPARYFSVSEPDLKRVRTTAGDFNLGDLEKTMNQPTLIGDIVEHWMRLAPTRRTVVFATSIAHSAALAAQFSAMGVSAEHVDAETPQTEREAIFQRFSSGTTQVLTNCTLASIGFDLPELDAVVFARPTKSVGLYLQMLGRGLRTAPGKQDCLVLDHAGNVGRHGFATDPRFWTLHGKYAIDQAKTARAKQEKEERGEVAIKCPKCSCVFDQGKQCPQCGYVFPAKARPVSTHEGQLVEFNARKRAQSVDDWSQEQKLRFFLELSGYASTRGYKPGWASFKYKERFGAWPEWKWKEHVEQFGGHDPSIETSRWIQAQMIAWRRSQAKVAASY